MSIKNSLENKRLRRDTKASKPKEDLQGYWVEVQHLTTNSIKMVSRNKAKALTATYKVNAQGGLSKVTPSYKIFKEH